MNNFKNITEEKKKIDLIKENFTNNLNGLKNST